MVCDCCPPDPAECEVHGCGCSCHQVACGCLGTTAADPGCPDCGGRGHITRYATVVPAPDSAPALKAAADEALAKLLEAAGVDPEDVADLEVREHWGMGS